MSNTGFDTLQIKRLIGNYDAHKGTILGGGEPLLVMVNAGVYEAPFFLLGDGINTIEQLIDSNKVFGSMVDVWKKIQTNGSDAQTTPISNTDVVGGGRSNVYSRSDHTHQLTKTVAESVLGVSTNPTSEFRCRKIMFGTKDPTTENVGGNIGDIYIKYEGAK